MDTLDKAILAELQKDGKLSMQDLADRVNSSSTQCWRRVRQLQDQGIILGYQAVLDAQEMQLQAMAYIHIALKDHSEKSVRDFLHIVDTSEQIIECCSITGDHDFMLKVVAHSPAGLERFLMRRLLSTGLVRETRSNFVLRECKTRGALPTEVV